MPLNKQVIAVPLVQGIDSGADPKSLAPGKLQALENALFTRAGSLTKRKGYTAALLTGTTTTPAAPALGVASNGDELVQLANGQLYSYNASTNAWADKGPLVPVQIQEQGVSFSGAFNAYRTDCAELSGFECHVSEGGNGTTSNAVYATVIERATGRTVVVDLQIDAAPAQLLGVVAAFGRFVVVWSKSYTTNTIYGRTVTTAGVLGSIVALATDMDTGRPDAGSVFAGGGRVYVAYAKTGTSDTKVVYATSIALAPTTLVTFTPTAAWQGSTGIVCASGLVWLSGWAQNATTFVERVSYTSAGAVSTALTLVYNYGVLGASSVIMGACEDPSTANTLVLWFSRPGTATRAFRSTVSTVVLQLTLESKPFAYGGNIYAFCSFADAAKLQRTLFLFDITGRVWGRALATTLSSQNVLGLVPSTPLVTGSTSVFLTSSRPVPASGDAAYAAGSVSRLTIDMNPVASCKPVRHGKTLVIPSSVVHQYDGSAVDEYGFLLYPEITGATAVAGGSLSAGAYQVCAVYEWVDDLGKVYRSTPSLPVTVTVSAGQQIQAIVRNLLVTNRVGAARQCTIELYRTAANGTLFQRERLSSELGTVNLTSTATQTIVVSKADSAVLSNPILYTQGDFNSGIAPLENVAPPSSVALCSYRGRIAAASGSRVYLSKQHDPADPAEFAAELYVDVDPSGGDITGLAAMDEKLVIFKDSSLYALVGDGPDNNGNNSDWREPQRIATQVGAADPRSIVVTDLGTFFKATSGIHVLGRDLAVTFIGAPVENYTAVPITSAVVCPRDRQVRFTTSGGPTLCLDYILQQWGTFPSQAGVSATYWQDKYVFQQSTAKVWVESATNYYDTDTTGAQTFIVMRLTTGWITFGQMQEFQRVYKVLPLGDYKSPHDLNISLAYDYDTQTSGDSLTIDATGVVGDDPLRVYQFGVALKQQKGQAVQVTLADSETTVKGESLSLTALSFLVGGKAGVMKVRTRKQVGFFGF